MSLSLVTICKDEAKTLGRFIRSSMDLVDEFIILDTGSTDGTSDILKQYGIPCHTFTWCDDFSAARNKALSLCKTQWCLFLDIDEIIHPQDRHKIPELLQRDYDFIDFKSHQFEVDYSAIKPEQDILWPSIETKVVHKTCLAKNLNGLAYHGVVHESINFDSFPDKVTFNSDIRIAHLRDRNKSLKKSEYYDQLEENSFNNGIRIHNAQLNHLKNLVKRGHRDKLLLALSKVTEFEARFVQALDELNQAVLLRGWHEESRRLRRIIGKQST